MSTYVFQPGDRLLDGYTVEKPLGHGGFGEVYHARSAGGKDVALKLIQRFLDVELRGVGHCLNLKHPHLVTIYDVKADSDGRQWIVMEYVAGESLADVIERHPDGMPVAEALRWFEPICQAVEHLHQSGIVHRDLKPGNIFDDRGPDALSRTLEAPGAVENGGTIKVGDYGLAKFITASKRSAQTQSVGTLHYMAPEVGSGRYGREVDVYAVGIILYEMLTGKVPFEGESAAEILMKHLTSPPDLDKLPAAFRGVVARMLAKNPNDRYGSVVSALNDLKAKIADHAHAEAIGEPSQYPAYEASVVSRPGASDWLEMPFGLFQAPASQRPTGTAPAPRGGLRRVLREHPVLSGAFALLCFILIAGALHGTGVVPYRDAAIGITILFVAITSLLITIVGYLMRPGSAAAKGTPHELPRDVRGIRSPLSRAKLGRPVVDAAEFAPTVVAGGRFASQGSRPPGAAELTRALRATLVEQRPPRMSGLRIVGILVWLVVGAAGVALALGFRGPTWVVITAAVVLVSLVVGLVVRGRGRTALGIVLLLAAAGGWLVTSTVEIGGFDRNVSNGSAGVNEPPGRKEPRGSNGSSGLSADAGPSEPTTGFTAYEHATGNGLVFHCVRPDAWNADAGLEADLLRVRFEAPDGQTAIELRQVADADVATARKTASTAASSDGAYILAHYLHEQIRNSAREQLTTSGLIRYSRGPTSAASRSPAGGVFTDKFFATDASNGELIQGLRATWYDGQVGLEVVCCSRNTAQSALESILEAMLSSISITQAG